MSIHSEVGSQISSSDNVVSHLITILQHKNIDDNSRTLDPNRGSSEVILSTLTTLNNLSYYAQPGHAICQQQLKITECK